MCVADERWGGSAGANEGRLELDLNGWWHTWFDEAADWIGERLPPPGAPLEVVEPVAPTAGWEGMEEGVESLEVPGTWDEARPGYRGVAWHWRPLLLPDEWRGRSIRLRLGGVRLYCQVYLDRELVGYDYDGLTPWEVDLTGRLEVGRRHELALRVVNPGGVGPGQRDSALRWGGLELPPSHDYGGVWGGVSLVGTRGARVEGVAVRTSADLATLSFSVRVVRAGGEARPLRLAVAVRDGGGREVARSGRHPVVAGSSPVEEVVVEVGAEGLAPWSPDSPALHEAVVTLEDGAPVDRVQFPFGVRHLAVRGDRYTLNGRDVEIRAARSEGWYPVKRAHPSARLAEQEVRAAKELGLNALWLEGHVAAPALLEVADRLGLFVVQRPPSGGRADLERLRLERLWWRDAHHPSACRATGGAGRPRALEVDSPAGSDGPAIEPLVGERQGLPESRALLGHYGRRILPQSDGEVWAAWGQRLDAQYRAHGLDRVFAEADLLARATSRAAYQGLARRVRSARVDGGSAGVMLPDWADEISGRLGTVTAFRTPKGDASAVAAAMAGLALALDGVADQVRTGEPVQAAIWALNEGGLRGSYTLQVRLIAPDGRLAVEEAGWVSLSGRARQPLGVTPFSPAEEGEHVVRAMLRRDGRVVCGDERSIWATRAPPLPERLRGRRLGVLGELGRAAELLGTWRVPWRPYALGDPVHALLIAAPSPDPGLANVLYSGRIRRVALLLDDPSGVADAEGWARWVPELGSARPTDPDQPPWLVGGWHRELLGGVGDLGTWWHVGGALVPRYALDAPLARPLVAAVGSTRLELDPASGGPYVGGVVGLHRLGEAELLLCALPVLDGVEARLPVAERLLRNIAGWLLGGV